MIQSGPTLLLLEANVKSTLMEREKAKIISPIHTSVVVTPDLYSDTAVPSQTSQESQVLQASQVIQPDESQPYRIGATPVFKDKVKSISTSRMRIEYKYLEDRLSSKYERLVTEGIECLQKIAYDLRYYYSSMQELVRGLDDERPNVREACIKAITKLGTRRLEKAIEAQVTKTILFLEEADAKIYKEQIEAMWKEIDENNNRRLAMIKVYEANNQINILSSNVPHLFVFHVDYRVSSPKFQNKQAEAVLA